MNCRYDWVFGPWSNCSCAVKFSSRVRRCVLFHPNSTQTYVSEALCNAMTPEIRRPCNIKFCPLWHVGHWSPVSNVVLQNGKQALYGRIHIFRNISFNVKNKFVLHFICLKKTPMRSCIFSILGKCMCAL